MTTPYHPDDSGRNDTADVVADGGTDAAASRVQRHLEIATAHIDVIATPIPQLKARAGQRTARRQRVAALGVVAAVSAGVVGGIAVLSQSEPSGVLTSSEAGSENDGEPEAEQAPATDVPGTQPGVVSPATAPRADPPSAAVAGGSEPDLFGDLQAAQETDPAFVWKVVDPGKEVSISGSFSGSLQGSFPTFALSTAPGRSNDDNNIQTFLYRSDDGINWTQAEAQPPFTSGFWNAQVNADQIFVTGTAPGIAKTEPNPLQIAVGTGDAWDIAQLPVDTNADAGFPMVQTNGAQAGSVPYGDGVLVVVTEQVYPDYRAINLAFGEGSGDFAIFDQQPDGITAVSEACINAQNDDGYDAALELFGPAEGPNTVPITSVVGTLQDGDDYNGCPVTKRTWAELGMPPESIDALTMSTSRFFTVSAALEITEIDGPGDGGYHLIGGGEPIVAMSRMWNLDTATINYELVDGGWVESAAAANTLVTQRSPEMQRVGDRRVALFGTVGDGRVPFMSVAADGTQSGVDLQALLATGAPASSSWADHVATTDSQWVGAVQTFDDPIAKAGGIDIPFGDVIVRQETQHSRFELLDAASGGPIDLAMVRSDNDGNVDVRNEAGDIRAQFHVEDVYEALSSPDEESQVTHTIVTTTDGTSFSVESVAALLGLTDDDVLRVSRVASDGTTVIVTVTLAERYPDETPKQLVLVGTPIG